MIGRFFGIWLLSAIALIGISKPGICGEVYLVFPEPEEGQEEKRNALGSSEEATETDNATRPHLRESSNAEVEKAWAKVKKPIYVRTAGGLYSEDQSATDAFMKGFVRRLTATNEFEISQTHANEDRQGDDRHPTYVLNLMMDKAKDGLYYGYTSISKVHRVCRCKDGFESRLSEEVNFSANIFCDYPFSRLVELGAEYAQQTYNAIERDLLRDMGFFWYTEEGQSLKGADSFRLPTEEPPSEITK